MKRLKIFSFLMCMCCALSAQESTENYIRTRRMLSDATNSYVDDIAYYDGLGRLFQTVQKAVKDGIAANKNMATLQEYDIAGRKTNSWLPIPVTSSGYLAPASFKSSSPGKYGNDSRPYSQPIYEASPLNRVLQQFGPGTAWYSAGRPVKTGYQVNVNSNSSQLNCRYYSVNSSYVLSGGNTNYATGQLSVVKTTDEDLNVSYIFTDKQGQTVLTRQMKGSEAHDTYYIYDDFENLCFVLQPKYQEEANLGKFAFQYKYDGRNRCIWKKLPDAAPIQYVYDTADRMTFSQDGNQSTTKWTFYEYDKQSRLTRKGECTNKTVNSSSPVHVVNYYDSYPFIDKTGFTDSRYDLTAEQKGYGKGYHTGSIITVLDGGTSRKIYVLNQYNIKGQVIKTVQNNLPGGFDVTETTYTFSGKPKTVTHKHTKLLNDANPQTEVYTYTYDHSDRLGTITHKLNSSVAVTIVNNVYDDFGRLKTNKRNGIAALADTYDYNIRSWINRISGTHLTENLTYSYGGNIASMQWQTGGKTRKYNYVYDGLSRLTAGTYTGASSAEKYGTTYTYDKNGNIKTLARYGKTSASAYGLVDNLVLNYTGNQLTNVTDGGITVTLPESNDFKKGSTVNPKYKYDKNGNLTQDLNKKITAITYNSLSLPQTVTINGVVHTYTYAADGTKLKVKQGSVERTYAGNFIYEGSSLKRILIEGGYIEGGVYYFYLNDHLGNTCTVANAGGVSIQRNHYYPFGLPMAETTDATQGKQPYKYNGKEFERKNGLNWMDYGARHYDAALGRFTTMDPLAEKYYSVSPYAYCENNPTNRIDPDGKQIIIPPTLLGMNPPLLGTSNPMMATGRNIGMLGTADKVVRALPKESHHIIPRSLKGNDVIKAAKEGGFKLDGKGNRISVDKFSKATGKGQHARHPNYTEQIKDQLLNRLKENPQMTPKQAVDVVNRIKSSARNAIQNNPNTKINDLKLEQQVAPMDNTKIPKPIDPIRKAALNQLYIQN